MTEKLLLKETFDAPLSQPIVQGLLAQTNHHGRKRGFVQRIVAQITPQCGQPSQESCIVKSLPDEFKGILPSGEEIEKEFAE